MYCKYLKLWDFAIYYSVALVAGAKCKTSPNLRESREAYYILY